MSVISVSDSSFLQEFFSFITKKGIITDVAEKHFFYSNILILIQCHLLVKK